PRHQRSEAEAERQQVDGRLDDRGERGRGPVVAEHRQLAAHHARDRGPLEPADPTARGGGGGGGAHAASSPVRSTNTSSSEAARRSAPSGSRPSSDSARMTATAGPVRRVAWPAASASACTSARRAGGPYTSTTSRPAWAATSSAGRPSATTCPS